MQPSTSPLENPTAVFSAVPDPSIDEQVQIWDEQWVRLSHRSFLGITNDEIDGEEDEKLSSTRRANITSGKLRSADTTAIKKVLWPQWLVFTPNGQHATYECL